ncbi:4-aminobutyrate aminotransferase/(S)-3-amino-2-methylpropionate transaminase [Devosia subaequoris]|uniref:4-aminobutyrate aminotransferase/(S)-3-amino-2-methylpropionate transaminase n=1 Tax=Devosia subaequoris TaxID=395930 RepID=A0A7W6ILE7_9HYPH|nr:4-aminobutyrate--2-oxoglutarate transaminase [Devosia subaequoris]MBB4051728.1 4-aminobutyrate aminotransferase/(S)-3-amino-2-methylpropionate transaminase [Devosia subaequoris]MCP1211477.1 4-aminobutyrate--2-oxoglutarate transaminase [Devosia subaequoris]
MSHNSDLRDRHIVAIPRGLASAFPVYAQRAENSEIWDIDGNRYIDFAGGIAVLNTGHRHPKVMAAVRDQLDHFTHTAFQILPYEPYVALCERLNGLAPFSAPAKSVLFSTGAEAVENAIKIARASTGRPGVIAFSGGFHGRTTLTMALTGKVAPYKVKFGVAPPAIYHVPFPAPSHGVSVADTLRALDTLFRADIAPTDVAAIIIEPVQGEGGFLPAPTELLQALRQTCDTHGIVLIADEVQTGFARTGKMFGIEHSGVEPDLLTVAKSLAGGFPLSGVIGRADIMDAAEPGGLGGTYAGSPMACAAALAVLDVIGEEGLPSRADALGATIRGALEELALRNDGVPISAIRGPGAMIAFDIVTDSGEPDAATTKRVIQTALADGLVLLSCGIYSNTIRILCPLTISDALLEEGLAKLGRALVATH